MIIVTGATGHIGNVVVKKLKALGKDVGIITHRCNGEDIFQGLQLKKFCGDIADVKFLEQVFTGAEAVIHLAAKISIQQGEYQELYTTNVVGTRNVMQAALNVKVPKVVYTSSVHALLERPAGEVITEIVPDDATKVLGDYAKTKVMAYHEVMLACNKGLNATVVFPAGVVGPFDYKPSQIGVMIKNSLGGKKNYYIKGRYNYVDVRDVANGIITALEKGRTKEGYALTGEVISVADFDREIAAAIGEDIPLIEINGKIAYLISFVTEFIAKLTPYSYRVLQSNCAFTHEKATKELGYQPRPLKQTLVDAVHWHQGLAVSLD